jgi:hypothetical protein
MLIDASTANPWIDEIVGDSDRAGAIAKWSRRPTGNGKAPPFHGASCLSLALRGRLLPNLLMQFQQPVFRDVADRLAILGDMRPTAFDGFEHRHHASPPRTRCRRPKAPAGFVASLAARVASGWSDRRVGLAPTGKRRLVTAHTRLGLGVCIAAYPEPHCHHRNCKSILRDHATGRGGTPCHAFSSVIPVKMTTGRSR